MVVYDSKNSELVHPYSYHIPILSNTCPSWKEILSLAHPIHLEKNAPLEGYKYNRHDFFYVSNGLVQIQDYLYSGKVSHGLCFAEGSLCNISSSCLQLDYSEVGLYCVKKALVYRFNGNLLQDANFLSNHPQQVMEAFRQLAKNALIHSVYNSFMVNSSPNTKLARFLLAYSFEKKSLTFCLPLKQEEVANLLKMHRVTFLKSMQNFKEEGILTLNKKEITIVNSNALEEIAQD